MFLSQQIKRCGFGERGKRECQWKYPCSVKSFQGLIGGRPLVLNTPKLCRVKATQAFYHACFCFEDPVEATRSGENDFVAEGVVKTFTCPVDGNPEPNIEWYSEKTGRKISTGKQIKTEENGCYTCVARNYLGSSVSITQCLIVGKPVVLMGLWPYCNDRNQVKTSEP